MSDNNKKELKKIKRHSRLAKILGFLVGLIAVLSAAAIIFEFNPANFIQTITNKATATNKSQKVSFNKKTNTLTTPHGQYVITSYSTATASVDVHDPNQSGHRLLMLYYTYTNKAKSQERPFTEWDKYTDAYQGDKKLSEGLQLVDKAGTDVELDNNQVLVYDSGISVNAVAHFDYNPQVNEPVVLHILNENGDTIYKITYSKLG